MLKPKKHHFHRAALEIAKHGDNDTLPFDIDVRFCGDQAKELAEIAYGFYSQLRDTGSPKENFDQISEIHVYSERLIAPSGPSGFRVVTKVHLFWNIYLNGLAIAIAEVLEAKRAPQAHSYRFILDGHEQLFDENRNWREFKLKTANEAHESDTTNVIVQTDISGFYEHVSHHYIENLINTLGGDAELVSRQVTAILSKLFAGRSFGLPVGGQGARILAELLLNEVDTALLSREVRWHRYVDDYVLIARNTAEAYRALGILAHSLMDYGLSLNKSKTIFLSAAHYNDYVRSQLGGDDSEAAKLRSIDVKFDPYSDNPHEDYESLVETVEALEVHRLLDRELEKSLPDSFLVTQIGRTIRLHEPQTAIDIARTLLTERNLHAFRSSFSSIMRGVANLRADERFSEVHQILDQLLDEVPDHSAHLLAADTSLIHYLRCLRLQSSHKRSQFVRRTFDSSQLEAVRRSCIDCWRGWRDRVEFNHLRNRWQQLSPECQRLYWLAAFDFGDEGEKAQQQAKRAAKQSWVLGVELPYDEVKDREKLLKLSRGSEPRFATLFMDWAARVRHAV